MSLVKASGLHGDMVVTQSNQLVEASYTLTLNEQRLVFAAISLHDSRKALPEKGTVLVSAAEFAKVFDIQSSGHVYESLEDAAKRLYNRSIKLIGKGPKGGIERNVRWVWMCEYRKKEGSVLLGFTPAIAPYLTQLEEQFTKLQLEAVGALSSFYAIRLYTLCKQYQKAGYRTVELEELRKMLDLGEKYPTVRELNRRVTNPSVAEINGKTDLEVICKPVSQGRKVTGFRFDIRANEQRQLPL